MQHEYNLTPRDLIGMRAAAGEIGIEIELEGRGLPRQIDREGVWTHHDDGSLRNGGAEYVLTVPVARDRVRAALELIPPALAKSTPNASHRTSVHVHVNVQNMTFREIFSYMTVYYIFEDYLVDWCGEDRVGNLFCLRLRDAEWMLHHIRQCVRDNDLRAIPQDNVRYSALNVLAAFRYGSLEFRSLRGTTDIDLIERWVNILLKIKDFSARFERPSDVMVEFSRMGEREFARECFGEEILREIGYPKHSYDIWHTVRLAQDLAYACPRGWEIQKVTKKAKTPRVDNGVRYEGIVFDDEADGVRVALNNAGIRNNPWVGGGIELGRMRIIRNRDGQTEARRVAPGEIGPGLRYEINRLDEIEEVR